MNTAEICFPGAEVSPRDSLDVRDVFRASQRGLTLLLFFFLDRALSEKIVSVLPRMKCPHQLEPHQIQGMDFIHIFPVVQVRASVWILVSELRVPGTHLAVRQPSLDLGFSVCRMDLVQHT